MVSNVAVAVAAQLRAVHSTCNPNRDDGACHLYAITADDVQAVLDLAMLTEDAP